MKTKFSFFSKSLAAFCLLSFNAMAQSQWNGNLNTTDQISRTGEVVMGNTSTPGQTFTTYGIVNLRRNDPNALISLYPSGGTGGRDWWVSSSRSGSNLPAGSFCIWDQSAYNLEFLNAARFVIDQTGKIGIGTRTPASKLDVNGTTTLRGLTTLNNVLEVNHPDQVSLSFNRTAAAWKSEMLFKHKGAHKWSLGSGLANTNVDDFYLYKIGIGPVIYADSNGVVGIGTSKPLSGFGLTVNSGAYFNGPSTIGAVKTQVTEDYKPQLVINANSKGGSVHGGYLRSEAITIKTPYSNTQMSIGSTGQGEFYIGEAGSGVASKGLLSLYLAVNKVYVPSVLGESVDVNNVKTLDLHADNAQFKALSVCNKIEAFDFEVKDVICSDFVFEKDYKLKSISEVENYIKENKHLPGIPSATETEKGVALGEFNNLLLQKVEELTLYIIELKKEIDTLKLADSK